MYRFISAIVILTMCAHCQTPEQSRQLESSSLVQATQPEWMKNAVLYEVNIRQYTPEGTFSAFQKHLPRLKELGVDILWLMPIHPIGKEKRKGTLGSVYAVQDYYAIHTDMGTKEEFRALIQAIHEAGMYVLMDWAASATAWDHVLTKSHPDWYLHDDEGNFITPEHNSQSDVIALDYNVAALREYMKNAMTYWVTEYDLDGYVLHVNDKVLPSFWEDVRKTLESVRPVILLADAPGHSVPTGFDIVSGWELEKAMQAVSRGEVSAAVIRVFIQSQLDSTSNRGIRMLYTSNHEKNAEEGSVFERFGKAAEAYAVLTYTMQGIPMIYSGQEVGLNHSLSLTEKDEISWGDHPFNALYSRLNKLKKDNPALWNGAWGGRMELLTTSNPDQIIAIYRVKDGNRVLAVFNCSPEEVRFTVDAQEYQGDFKSFKSRSTATLTGKEAMTLPAWGYEVYTAR
ncbi:alpha-amylase family glycosyl hydrolase [Marinoscillum sp. 108]|uniref:alpha-amylase family glycosyl hydrolase n=1 Tax=Marinoscillum sp. 108 TaxID=2653151 RepID=UPI001357FDCD|nr:alpha-amylase family glycosyl hydrolase [Marinoscillum sp. 108]